jgi:hypothetical protein
MNLQVSAEVLEPGPWDRRAQGLGDDISNGDYGMLRNALICAADCPFSSPDVCHRTNAGPAEGSPESRQHRRAARHRDQDQGLRRRLPFRRLVLGLRKLRDVVAGILECDEFAAAGQWDRIVECPLPALVSLQWRQPFLSAAILNCFWRQPDIVWTW